ncbi:MAG: hypothetical protein A2Y64_08460 [Candidatus Coatesbacteria bacterium RBG_13_66_14]|uniref:Secreted protein n=1 Tax=Candidatus Coatesbacteria bacterium RBG_13_66_14 TaxID=1817816 RepID=A0A1F5FHP1_9BACT|nr:MAG: hypothetical protein A2Y64_08460 [Candidatus Coatesbacteria bacterium RBG_13_66_14]
MHIRCLIIAILTAAFLPHTLVAAEDYELPANESALWGYANELFDLTRAYGIVAEKTEEEILALFPRTKELLERLNADLSFWIADLTDRGILGVPGTVNEALDCLIHDIFDKVSTTIAVFLDEQHERGAYFIASLRHNCETLTEYFHYLGY